MDQKKSQSKTFKIINYISIIKHNIYIKKKPDFIAVCVPFILGTFRKPAEQPIIAPPGKAVFGID